MASLAFWHSWPAAFLSRWEAGGATGQPESSLGLAKEEKVTSHPSTSRVGMVPRAQYSVLWDFLGNGAFRAKTHCLRKDDRPQPVLLLRGITKESRYGILSGVQLREKITCVTE